MKVHTGLMSNHWDEVYDTRPIDAVSWYELEPVVSLELGEALGVTSDDAVLDVGAGASLYVDHLLRRGYHDLTVLDVSASAVQTLLARVACPLVRAVVSDVTSWESSRTFDVWHDREVLHFISPERRALYFATLRRALSAHGAVIIGVFAPDGPTTCSGLSVTRYDAEGIMELLGDEFDLVEERRTVHVTPWGAPQSFQWVAARRGRQASSLSLLRPPGD